VEVLAAAVVAAAVAAAVETVALVEALVRPPSNSQRASLHYPDLRFGGAAPGLAE